MIRHRCIACGRSINRTDRIFEASDGTLCHDCGVRLATGKAEQQCGAVGVSSTSSLLCRLPELRATALLRR